MAGLEDARFRSAEYGFLHRTFPSAYPDYTRFVNQRRSGDIVFKKCPDRRTPSDPLRDWVKKHLPKSLAWTNEEVTRRYDAYHHFNKSIPDVVSPFVDKFARFIIALTGGLSLVVPMLIMRLQQNSNKSLITTSVAVVLFSGVVSIVFRASNAETLSITAAYAAVLVVFVGTST